MKNEWGIIDTVDNVWIGNDDGPLSYATEEIAQVAARVTDPIMGYEPGRCRARRLPSEHMQVRDEVETKMTSLAALIGIEEGRIL